MGNNMLFHVSLEQAEDGWIVAECPALPGCVSQGKDEDEALLNIKEVMTGWLWAEDQKAIAKYTSVESPSYSGMNYRLRPKIKGKESLTQRRKGATHNRSSLRLCVVA
jgi:predicted RNase H-like HicB family nuclease